MPHGGKRPGAGAPKGNLNGLKHGRYSKRVQEHATNLLLVPEFAELLLAVVAHKGRRRTGAVPLGIPNRNAVAAVLQHIASGALVPRQAEPLIDPALQQNAIKLAFGRSLENPPGKNFNRDNQEKS